MAKQYSIERFDPRIHAGLTHQYPGTHVVVGELPLRNITFNPADDELAVHVGERRAELCPKLGTLVARAAKPPIKGLEPNQHLDVACESRVQVIGRDRVTSYGICVPRAARLGLTPGNLSDDWLTDPGPVIKNAIRCPLAYLGGHVTFEGGSVPVAVDAHHPDADPDQRFYAW